MRKIRKDAARRRPWLIGLPVAAALVLAQTATGAEQPAGAATAETGTAAVSPDAATTPATPSAEPPVAPAAHPHKVLLATPAFTEFQNPVSGIEAMPDWTEAARRNLTTAAEDTLKGIGGLEVTAMPELTGDEAASLHDHVAVAQLIVSAGVEHKSGEWRKHRAEFDRSFGDGLQFLRERTGADYLLVIDGTQVHQSGGRAAMRILGTLAAAAAGVIVVTTGGGGQVVNACLLDLSNGEVAWFNSSRAIDIFASAGADLRDAAATQGAVKKLFAGYPSIPALAD